MSRTVHKELSETGLVRALRMQEQAALEALYDKYSAALYGVISRIVPQQETAEDLLQETFVKIWYSFSSYDPQKGRLFTWMMNIARNLCIDKIRTKEHRNAAKNQDIENFIKAIDDTQHSAFNTDVIGLRDLVGQLLPVQRTILSLLYFQGYTHKEAAEKLDIPVGTLKTHTRKAILAMRLHFGPTPASGEL